VQPIPVPPPVPPPAYPAPGPYGPYGPPPRRRGGGLVTALLVGGGLLLGIVVVAALLAPKDTLTSGPPTTAPAVTARPTSTTTPGLSVDQAAPLGTELSPAKGWAAKVTAVELDADATMAANSFLSRPGRGQQFVLVTVQVTNQGAKPASVTEMKASLLTPDGVAHGVAWNPTPDRLDTFAQLQPGATVSGNLAFEVPKAQAAGAVLLAEPLFTLDQRKDQRFFALS
jgi:hypothetical protein